MSTDWRAEYAAVAETVAPARPTSRSLGDGWRVDCVPSPYLSHPAATVGLGDTFVAGLLLSSCLGSDLHLERRPAAAAG